MQKDLQQSYVQELYPLFFFFSFFFHGTENFD